MKIDGKETIGGGLYGHIPKGIEESKDNGVYAITEIGGNPMTHTPTAGDRIAKRVANGEFDTQKQLAAKIDTAIRESNAELVVVLKLISGRCTPEMQIHVDKALARHLSRHSEATADRGEGEAV